MSKECEGGQWPQPKPVPSESSAEQYMNLLEVSQRARQQENKVSREKLEGKDQQIERQAQTIDRLSARINELKDTINSLDAELDEYKERPNTSDSKMHIAAAKTLQGMGYFYNGGTLWKPPLGQPPKYLEARTPTENAIQALTEFEDVLLRRGLDNKSCLNALAYHFTERAKRRT